MEVELCEISCAKCQVLFWITKTHDSRLRNCRNTFYCPRGHGQSYEDKTDIEKAIENQDWYKNRYESQQKTSERLARSNSALRGVITRQKNVSKSVKSL